MEKNENKRMIFFFLILSIGISFILCFLYYDSIQKMKKISLDKYKILSLKSDNEIYPYSIDEKVKVGNKIYIEGWIVDKGKDNVHINRVIVLKDNKNNFYQMFTKSIIRKDVTKHFGNTYQYDGTGLIAKGKLKKNMEYPFKVYFLIKEKGRNILIDTNQKLEKE